MSIFNTLESAHTWTNILTIWSNEGDFYACNFLLVHHVYDLTQCYQVFLIMMKLKFVVLKAIIRVIEAHFIFNYMNVTRVVQMNAILQYITSQQM